MVTNVSSVTPTSEAPVRGTPEQDYSDTADAWASSITVTTTSWNNSISEFNTAAEEVNVLAQETEANANSAVAAANAVTWVDNDNYVVGDGVYSPIDLFSYRAKNDQTPSTTDPSLDPTNWQNLEGGDFFGPASSTLNAAMRFSDTGGKEGKNSGVIIDDSDNVSGIGTLASGAITAPSINFGDNTLSTYDEGVFTPVLEFGGASVGITYSVQIGKYTKTGDVVKIWINITLSSKGSSTGNASFTGLPFTSVTGLTQSTPLAFSVITGAAYSNSTVRLGASATLVTLFKNSIGNTGGDSPLQDTDFSNTTVMQIRITYKATS